MSISERHAKTIIESKERINRVEGILFGALVDAKQPYLMKLDRPESLTVSELADIALVAATKFVRELAEMKNSEMIEALMDPKSEESSQISAFLKNRGETNDQTALLNFAVSFVAKNAVLYKTVRE